MMQRNLRRGLVGLLAFGVLLDVRPASAAMLVCEAEVSGGLKSAATEIEARRLTMQAWLKAAAALGEGYANWRNAANKQYSCSRSESGEYRCLAKAVPCTITQKPLAPGTFEKLKPKGVEG